MVSTLALTLRKDAIGLNNEPFLSTSLPSLTIPEYVHHMLYNCLLILYVGVASIVTIGPSFEVLVTANLDINAAISVQLQSEHQIANGMLYIPNDEAGSSFINFYTTSNPCKNLTKFLCCSRLRVTSLFSRYIC